MTSFSDQRVFGLDVIRTIAIGLVVCSHCTYLLFSEASHSLVTLIRIMGAVGVDLFFVLSGFLIGGIILKHIQKGKTGYTDLKTFWKRRWLRTLPNYYLILFIHFVIAWVTGTLPERWGSYLLFLQNFSQPHPDFFTEAWSLSVEEYAYLLLPLILFIGFNSFAKGNKSIWFFRGTLGLILLLYLVKLYYWQTSEIATYKAWSASFRKVVIYRIDSIYMGFLAVYLMWKYSNGIKKNKILIGAIGALLFLALHLYIFMADALPQSHLWFYSLVYLPILILSLGLMFAWAIWLPTPKKYIQRVIEFISVRAYAIYLVNYSLVLLYIQKKINVVDLNEIEKIGGLLLFLAITIMLSSLLYRYFEVPILKLRDKKYQN